MKQIKGKDGKFVAKDYSYLINTVIDDMTVLGIERIGRDVKVKVKCNICGKERYVPTTRILRHSGTSHKYSCFLNDPHRYDHLVNTNVDDMHIDAVKLEKKYAGCNKMWYAYMHCNVCGHEKIASPEKLMNHAGTIHRYCNRGRYPVSFVETYAAIIERLTDPASICYKRYGGRGITCTWKDLDEFAADMLESYNEAVDLLGEKNVSIERIDVDGNYCKENCIWIDNREQASNTRRTIYYCMKSPTGKEYIGRNLLKFCRKHGINGYNCNAMLRGLQHTCQGWTGHRITKEEYEAYWNSQPIPADMSEISRAFKFCYDKCSTLDRYQTDKGVRIPLNMIHSAFCMFIPHEAIEALCELPNDWNLEIDYDEKNKFFYVSEIK